MRHLLISAALLLAVLLALTSGETYYVTPNASIMCPEEGVPCFTLSQYATKPNKYFAFNTTLILLPGNHNLDSELRIRNIVNLAIVQNTTANYSDGAMPIIQCSHLARFTLNDIGAVSMRGLMLIGCMNNNITTVEQFTLEDCIFQGQGHDGTGQNKWMYGGAVYAASISDTTIHSIYTCMFNDLVTASGGTVYAESSNITICNTTFHNNIATGKGGGVLHARSSYITIQSTTFKNNTATGEIILGGAVYAESSYITIQSTTFSNNTAGRLITLGGAIYACSSNITICNTAFNSNTATGENMVGGVVYAESSNITICNTAFNNNTAAGRYNASGGAVFVESSNITIITTTFNNNTVTGPGYDASGGAVYVGYSNITIHNTTFNNNTLTGKHHYALGGAMYAGLSNVTIHNTTFINNNNTLTGKHYALGGAMYARISNITIHNTTFGNNIVIAIVSETVNRVSGGAVYADSSIITIHTTTFNNNIVAGENGQGGAMYLKTVTLNSTKLLIIKNNVADKGSYSALYALQSTLYFSGNTTISNNYGSLYAFSCNVTFMGHTNIMNNSYLTNTSQEGGAVTAIQSQIVFTGTVTVSNNSANMHGGGISATQSKLYVYGDITIAHNTASLSGGGIYAYQSELNLENRINISNNSAVERGGGIHVISSITKMTDHSKTYFVRNHAKRGGGICLEMSAKLYIVKKKFETIVLYSDPHKWIMLQFAENFAAYGGALYISDDTNSATCHAKPFSIKSTISSECFIQGLTLAQRNQYTYSIKDVNIQNTYFTNNSASKAGHEIYGGLLDRCTINPYAEIFLLKQNIGTDQFIPGSLSAVSYFLYETNQNFTSLDFTKKIISSDPVRVCFCTDSKLNCSYYPEPIDIQKGETFTMSLVAVDQVNNTISNFTILSQLSTEAGLGEGQSNQTTGEGCTELHYTITSLHTSEQLHLYADGPCKDTGISVQTVDITFKACPIGFKDTGSKCDCNPELKMYISDCSIDTESVLRKDNVWIAFMNTSTNTSVVTYPNCPFDYCYPSTKQIRIRVNIPDDADKQCAFNRSGKLCGSCKDGLSLSLGSSHCLPCSNNWLALLIVFAIAGIALVAFLLVCNLTVAAGTVNGLLFYANIVSSNKAVFFTNSTNRFLAIFIAWLNLDFGFITCFFNGLNGYSKTWLQLAFPAYVIFLVVLIIKACEYSAKFTRFMRRIARNNPVATLDTLVLLSYTKSIRTIISAWQFATLEYSDGTRETVWLVDGNIKYFKLKHIPLFVTALVIFILALTYTLFMFLWQWLLLCPNRQPVRWIRNSKLHGIMNAYFITFNKNHRYWTGLLLLARVLLYLVSALNGVNTTDPGMNLLAISCVIGSLILWKEVMKGNIYRNWLLNILDTSFLFNLLILTVATFYVRYVGGNQTAVASISVSITFITFVLIISYHAYTFVFQSLTEKIKAKLFEKHYGPTFQPQQILNMKGIIEDHDGTVSETVVEVPQIPVDTEGNLILDGFVTDEEDNPCTTISNNQIARQAQTEMEGIVSDNTSGTSSLSVPAYAQDAVVKDEEISDASDELAPLLPVNST